jgi:hypothetical protein
MGNHSKIVAGKPTGQKQPIYGSQTAAHITLSAPEWPFIFRKVTDREREREREREGDREGERESRIAHAIKT